MRWKIGLALISDAAGGIFNRRESWDLSPG